MPNPFDSTQNIKMYHGATRNFHGTLSDVATDITISVSGVYKVGASVDWCGRGPTDDTSAATQDDSQFWFAKEWQIVTLESGDHISQVRASSASASGVYYANLLTAGERA